MGANSQLQAVAPQALKMLVQLTLAVDQILRRSLVLWTAARGPAQWTWIFLKQSVTSQYHIRGPGRLGAFHEDAMVQQCQLQETKYMVSGPWLHHDQCPGSESHFSVASKSAPRHFSRRHAQVQSSCRTKLCQLPRNSTGQTAVSTSA